MADQTQTEQDTAKARSRLAPSRVTRSEEYQRRVDAANSVEQVGTPQGNVNFVASSTTASSGGGGGGLGKGYMVLYADGESVWIDSSGFGSGVKSIYFQVQNGAVVKGGQGSNENRELWLGTGSNQSAVYIPIDYIADVLGSGSEALGGIVSTGGMYRETIICVNGEPTITFVRV